jgi:hypothetical protein
MPSDSNHHFSDQNKARQQFPLIFPRSEAEIFRDVTALGPSASRHSLSVAPPEKGIKTTGYL